MSTENEIVLDITGLANISGTITVYNFAPDNGLYIGSSLEFLSKGVGIPAYSTIYAPFAEEQGKACIYNNEKWKQVADHRGETVYLKKTGEAITLNHLGDYPENITLMKPKTKFDRWIGEGWITDTALQHQAITDEQQAQKDTLISEALSVTQVWQTQLLLGIISETEKEKLKLWMQYLQAVRAIDVVSMTVKKWPDRPIVD